MICYIFISIRLIRYDTNNTATGSQANAVEARFLRTKAMQAHLLNKAQSTHNQSNPNLSALTEGSNEDAVSPLIEQNPICYNNEDIQNPNDENTEKQIIELKHPKKKLVIPEDTFDDESMNYIPIESIKNCRTFPLRIKWKKCPCFKASENENHMFDSSSPDNKSLDYVIINGTNGIQSPTLKNYRESRITTTTPPQTINNKKPHQVRTSIGGRSIISNVIHKARVPSIQFSTATRRSSTSTSTTQIARLAPVLRRHLRSRVFRTTLLVILAHVLLWLPYNAYALMKYCNGDLYQQISEHANVLKDMQFLITLINPFLYAFGK